MVRPDLRRDLAGIPEISGPQERERCGVPRGNIFTPGGGGSTVPSGEPSSQGRDYKCILLDGRSLSDFFYVCFLEFFQISIVDLLYICHKGCSLFLTKVMEKY
jgi:hypothetical protein